MMNFTHHNYITNREINLSTMKLKKIPEWIYESDEYNELKVLVLSGNNIKNIPNPPILNLSVKLQNLVALNLGYNLLSSLPYDICNLQKLENLIIANNNIISLPDCIGKLINLRLLDIQGNNIKKIPNSIGNLTLLQELYANYNKIVYLPKSLCLLSKLTYLNISYNRIKTFPQMIGNLKLLRNLDCNDNKIRTLPESFWDLVNLSTLQISNNRICILSPEIGKLGNLVNLYICDNRLSSLPPSITRLATNGRLWNIDISGNPIEFVPPQVRRILDRQISRYNTIYTDNQNIHNHAIQLSLVQSIENIMGISPSRLLNHDIVIEELMANQGKILKEETISHLLEYIADSTIHTKLQITFAELFIAFWNMYYILNQEHRIGVDILERLNQEIADSYCKCFTGRITRLVNVLSGFTPLVNIQIGDNEQIAIIIKKTKQQLESQPRHNGQDGQDGQDGQVYNIEKHRELVKQEMLERGYTQDIIDEWIQYIE